MGPPPLPRPKRDIRLPAKLSNGDNAATPEVSMHCTDTGPSTSQPRLDDLEDLDIDGEPGEGDEI